MASSNVALVTSMAAFGAYAFSAYYLSSDRVQTGMAGIVPPRLHAYGQLKFLTYQCLLIQMANAVLHVAAHFVKPLRGARDLWFTTLAYPIGSIVVYTFWFVWHTFGRESIFPSRLDQFYPPWLNHITHSLIVPVNFVLMLSFHHKHSSGGVLITLAYAGLYTVFLHVIKAQTGLFVYGYLNEMNDTERLVYFASTGVFAYLCYKSGQLLTYALHACRQAAGAGDKYSSQKPKPKQK